MIRTAIVLTALLTAGCASTARHDLPGTLSPISMHSWQQVLIDVHDAPLELRRAVTQAGEARLPRADQTVNVDAEVPRTSRVVLYDVLTHSDDLAFLPDAEFANLHNVVSGENRQLEQPYATALASYLAYPDFICQQPLYGRYFQRRYGAGSAAKICPAEVPFSVLSRYEVATNVWLDPQRVKSIHLLFAGKSESMASRFGHLALRLVVCPEGNPSAAECDSNLSEHLVLGFQAHVDEFSLNTLKALNGDYKAYLFANKFMDVYQEYAIGEFRELYSLPLLLDDPQLELLVRELADIHWSFAGSYNFFTRNCATLLQNALRAAWPQFAASDKLSSDFLRPDSFFEAIKASPLVDSDRLASLAVAEREGYFFSSTREFYQRALLEVRAQMNSPAFADIENYMQIDPIKRRNDRAEDTQFFARLANDQHLLEAQIMLEEYALMRGERLMMIEGAKYFEEQDFAARSASILAQLDADHAKVFADCLLTPFKQHTSPIRRLSGIPDKSDITAISGETSHCQSMQNKQLLRETIGMIQDAKSEHWQKLMAASYYLSESIANLNLLKQM